MTFRTTSSTVVYSNKWMTVREDEFVRPDGSPGLYGVVEKPDFALIVPLDNDGFHLVEQFRYPVQQRFWEFPQGGWEDSPDADPADVARGELREETGLRAGSLTRLGHIYEAYGYSDQGCHVFLATDLTAGSTDLTPEEADLRHAWFPRADVETMIADGSIRDGVTIAAYTLLTLHERGL